MSRCIPLKVLLFPVLGTFLLSGGCFSQQEPLTMEGIVVDGGREIVISSVLPGAGDAFNRPPVPGTTVYLAHTTDTAIPIKGYQAVTKKDGTYQIRRVELLPPAKDPDGRYYSLVVKRAGYEPLIRKISIGPWAQFMRNTVVLKKQKKD